ncbi:MAG: undecaprenyl/decaprenyl-phosphate alpha-N-acetylglucosaminyl 1-phosphate transferase [Betaproteobacteria bacterium]|nr:undecaprenyl/decaprenyl-phosphate alpha-N-acetylglucosaminyl 1-phosphate transferase [Betaproteobacteria bacterium]
MSPAALLIDFLSAIAAGLLFARVAPSLGLVDHPGGRKDHVGVTPLVGGLAIFSALVVSAAMADVHWIVVLATLWVVIAGVADDRFEIPAFPRFILQGLAALTMAYGAGVVLSGVGNLIGVGPLNFGPLAIVMTVFCVVGVINAINMIDGVDGLSGSIAATAFAAYAYVAHESNLYPQTKTLLTLLAGTLGFLMLNMRLPWNPKARIFMGDTGSMLTGFLIAWFAVDLTMGAGRSFAPINALWVVMIPLCDCVSLMVRRKRAGRKMTEPDSEHLHHYFKARGFSIPQTQWAITGLNAAFALAAIAAWKWRVPEPVMFGLFVVFFVAYHRFMKRAFATSAQNIRSP